LKVFHAKILLEKLLVLSGEWSPVVQTVNKETLKVHAEQIRKDVRDIVQLEFGKMSRDAVMGEWVLKP
jgi:hypothetical protein